MQRKNVEWLEAKTDGEARTIEGYGSTFESVDNPDAYGDIVARSAFDATLARNLASGRIKICDQHGQACGIITDASVDARGLRIVGKISATPQGDALLTYCKDRVYGELSIGYRALKTSRPAAGVRSLDEVELLEVSPCPWGANANAVITAVKSAGDEARDALDALVELERKASLWGSAFALQSIASARREVEDAVSYLSYGEGASEELADAIKKEFDDFKAWVAGQTLGSQNGG